MQDLAPRTYFDRILCLTDLKARSQSALSYARAFTRYYSSHLTLLHACAAEAMDASTMPFGSHSLSKTARHVELLAAEMVNTGLNVDAVTRVGASASNVLTKTIDEMHPDLIIQGSAGIDDLRRSVIGSVAESIFRTSKAPVLTVGPQVLPYMGRPLELNKILFVSDFGARSKVTAIYALSLAQEFRAHIRLCHVHDESVAALSRPQIEEMLAGELNRFVHPNARDWCDPECTVVFGAAAPMIQKMSEQYCPDLIVLGAHGLGILGTHGEPGTAFKVMANAKCPVLSLLSQPGKAADPPNRHARPDLISQC